MTDIPVDKRLPVAGLSFRIEGGEPAVLRYHGDGCRPATGPEVELWNALTAAQAELHQYRLSPQLGCSADAEVWHQLRMKMDAALGPDFDPYVRGECFAALDSIVKQRDDARLSATARDEEVTEMWLQVAAAVGVSPGTTLAESINCIDSMRDRLTARDEAFETILRVAEYMPEGHHKESIRNTINAVRAR